MLAGIKDILIIVNKGQIAQFKKIIPNGINLGIKISYKEQLRPRGLPDAFILGRNSSKMTVLHLYLEIIFFMDKVYQKNLLNVQN